ncbi:cytochrome P450, partial [Reticulomyxa filosa]
MEEASEHSLNILQAGTDTTSSTMCFAMYYLAKYPDIQAKVREEMLSTSSDVALADSNEHNFSYGQSSEVQYTTAFLKEVLRLYPAAPFFSRRAIEDDSWNGYPLPKGSIVWINPYQLGRNKKVWGDNVLEFSPERFTSKRRGSEKPYAWVPFGSGARQCIGFRLSMLEMKIVLSHLLKHFQITFEKENQVPEMKEVFEFFLTTQDPVV